MLSMENTPFTPQPTNGEDWAAKDAARLRESLGLAVYATQEQVDSTITAKDAARLRESLGGRAIR